MNINLNDFKYKQQHEVNFDIHMYSDKSMSICLQENHQGHFLQVNLLHPKK